jgi:formylglycine-generating enzyme required for sulfatase activity
VSWYDAAEYCNWLSAQERIPPEQWCYEPNADGKFAEGMRMKAGWLSLAGYRLPTEAEWEYACRAGAVTCRFHGETEELFDEYAWYKQRGPGGGLMSPGSRKPNDFGLFDMLGNAIEWVQDPIYAYPAPGGGKAVEDREFMAGITGRNRVLRGGGYGHSPLLLRCAFRSAYPPGYKDDFTVGFRPARTYP